MNKEELVEFVKLFKEETAPVKTKVKGEEDKEEEEEAPKKYKKKKTKKSWWESCEDRLFTFLIMISTLIYLYLMVTGQSFILDREIKRFNKSQSLLFQNLAKISKASSDQPTRKSKEAETVRERPHVH